MAAANYRLCDRCRAKTFYDSDVDYEDSNLGTSAALCKDCAQTHEITIAKRGEIAELRAAGHQSVRLIEWLSSREGTALEDAAEAEALVNRLRAALAATEGSE